MEGGGEERGRKSERRMRRKVRERKRRMRRKTREREMKIKRGREGAWENEEEGEGQREANNEDKRK